MLKRNKKYKDIAAAYMKLIKPRKPESTSSDADNLVSRPLSKISEEQVSRISSRPNIEVNEIATLSPNNKAEIAKFESHLPNFSNTLKIHSVANIIRKARSEQFLGKPKETNLKLSKISNKELIDDLHKKVNKTVQKHADVFIDKFKGELYNVKKKYAELEMSTNENLKKIKMDKEIIDKRAERDK